MINAVTCTGSVLPLGELGGRLRRQVSGTATTLGKNILGLNIAPFSNLGINGLNNERNRK